MTAPRVRAAGDTHPGLQRTNNEDRFFFDDRRGIYCVIDGVGGHAAGERAAAIAAETILASLDKDPSRLRDAFVRANDAVYRAASADPKLRGMACVATLAVLDGTRVRFAHMGDTRLYKIRGGRIEKLTHDQSPVGELEDSGALTETEAMRHPRRNEIYRDLGSQPPGPDFSASIEIGEAPFEHDAALVLCSDGLSDQVSSGSIRRIVERFAGSPALAVQELLVAANDAGGKDNVTAVVVEGEGFAASVQSRGPRTGTRAPQPAPSTAPRAAAPAGAPARRRGGGVGASLWLLTGMLLGALGLYVAQRSGFDLERLVRAASTPPVAAARTWRVGLDPSADFDTIGAALERAADGDTVSIGPGEYREALVLKEGVSVVGSRDSVLRPPLGAPSGWTAVRAEGIARGRLSGLLIAGAADQPLGVGVLAERATIEIDDVEVVGATVAGMDLRAGARVTVRRSHVHDNPGGGIIIRSRAEPRLERNVIMDNGHGSDAPRPGVLIEPDARPILVANAIGGNGGPAVAGWPAGDLAELVRQNVLSPVPATSAPASAPRRGTAPRQPRTRPRT
ncbi:MAG TPA: protein phosphatase 2C domain-containing protein [Vicinamibacterales bacterium]